MPSPPIPILFILAVIMAAAGALPPTQQVPLDEGVQDYPRSTGEVGTQMPDQQVVLEERRFLGFGGGRKKKRQQQEQEALMAQQRYQQEQGDGYYNNIRYPTIGDARRQQEAYQDFVKLTKKQTKVNNPEAMWIYGDKNKDKRKSAFGPPPNYFGYMS